MEFKDRLAAAMGRASATPRSLSVALGVSVQAIGQTLSGATRALTAENCAKAAKFLGVDLFWLATGVGEMRPVITDHEMSLSSEERDLIIALRLLPVTQRETVFDQVKIQAREQLEHLGKLLNTGPYSRSVSLVVPIKSK